MATGYVRVNRYNKSSSQLVIYIPKRIAEIDNLDDGDEIEITFKKTGRKIPKRTNPNAFGLTVKRILDRPEFKEARDKYIELKAQAIKKAREEKEGRSTGLSDRPDAYA